MGIDNTETGIGVMIQDYEDGNTAEILMIQYDGQQDAFEEYNWTNPEIEAVNNMIEAGPLRMYNDFLNGDYSDDLAAVDIRSYPFADDDLVQIVTSCVGLRLPETSPDRYTKLWSYCFSKTENRVIDLDEMLEKESFTRQEISDAFSELYRPDFDDERLIGAEVTGFLINNLPSGSVTNFLLEVMVEMESGSYKSFYMYTPAENAVRNMPSFRLFDPEEWDMVKMAQPLAYEREDVSQPDYFDYEYELVADTTGFDEHFPGEYLLDGVLYVRLLIFPPLAAEAYGEEEVEARIKELADSEIRVESIALSDEQSTRLTYPAWLVEYETGANEDTRYCKVLYFQTDGAECYALASIPVDYKSEYQAVLEQTLESVVLVAAE
ncbi:MAG: hypothetical protein LBH21_01755 [Gracilibacteraceae bacterium]|nr:hypothetical protein [Gracilibacteraceae bacterium]